MVWYNSHTEMAPKNMPVFVKTLKMNSDDGHVNVCTAFQGAGGRR